MVYTATVMTENAYYPIFLLAALALVALLERPSAARYVAFFAALGTRLSDPLPGDRGRGRRRHRARSCSSSSGAGALRATLWSYRWLYAVVRRRGASSSSRAQVARGRPLNSLLGSYAVVGEAHYDVVARPAFRRLSPRRARPLPRRHSRRRRDRPDGAGALARRAACRCSWPSRSACSRGRPSSSARSPRASPTASRSATCSRSPRCS